MPRSISDAYLKGDARAFFEAHPTDVEHRRALVEKVLRPLTPRVADELEAQNAGYAPSPTREKHLAQLREGAAAIVTGQQVGLFLGPLYTVYKAAAAIRNARRLARETGRPVVPVFWLQTEDHDLPEIACCELPVWGRAPRALRAPAASDGRTSVAHQPLSPHVDELLARLDEALGELPHGSAHLAFLRRHYRPGAGWATAFAGALAELFADEGLVLVDPRTPTLAAELAPVHRRALCEAPAIAHALLERSSAVVAAGFTPSVHVRPDAPLSFFHPEGPEGPRFRLEPHGDGFIEVGGRRTHTRAELLARLEREPLSFSTSALLRPIVQDTLLPTVAYVGGPGELAYFAQLSPLYRLFERPMPVIVPRARFRLIEPRAAELLRRFGASPEELERSDEHRWLSPEAGAPIDAEWVRLTAAFEAALEALTGHALAARPALATPVRKTRSTARRAIGKLRGKYDAARAAAVDPRLADVRALKAMLQPGGAPQERVFGLSRYAALVGERALVARIVEAVEPFDGTLRELYL